MTIDYEGDNIAIEEMPQGCIINHKNGEVIISSTKDALAVIASLTKMLQFLEQEDII